MQNLQQENTRVNALMNQIQITNRTPELRNWRSDCRCQTSISVDYRLQFLACEPQQDGIHLLKVEAQKNLRNLREENTSLTLGNLRQLSEMERYILNLHQARIETARNQSPGEDAQNALNRWNYTAEEMYPTVGSGYATLLLAAHTA